MTDLDYERRANEMIVTGALFAMLHQTPGVRRVDIPGDESASVWVWLDFMKSRYRVTVTLDPEVLEVR